MRTTGTCVHLPERSSRLACGMTGSGCAASLSLVGRLLDASTMARRLR
jgi:hypothetical protein